MRFTLRFASLQRTLMSTRLAKRERTGALKVLEENWGGRQRKDYKSRSSKERRNTQAWSRTGYTQVIGAER